MQVSPFGIAMIKRFEGVSLHSYKDAKGLISIGVGHLLPQTTESETLLWTEAQVDAQLMADLETAMAAIRARVMVQLSQPQFDAISSLVFNIGIGHFAASTALTEINRGRPIHAAKAFLLWDDRGLLTARREFEKNVFIYGTLP